MDKEKVEQFRKEITTVTDALTVKDVMNVNHKPFPFCIGPKHVAYAADHCGGMLDKEICNKIPSVRPKGYRGPDVYMRDITFDKVAFLQLTRNATNEELQAIVPGLEKWKDDVDGVCLVETAENYRVTGDPE